MIVLRNVGHNSWIFCGQLVKLLINTAVVIGGDFNFVLCESHWSYRLSREFFDEHKSQIAYCIYLLSLALVALLAHFLLVPSCVRMTLCHCSLQLVACMRTRLYLCDVFANDLSVVFNAVKTNGLWFKGRQNSASYYKNPLAF